MLILQIRHRQLRGLAYAIDGLVVIGAGPHALLLMAAMDIRAHGGAGGSIEDADSLRTVELMA